MREYFLETSRMQFSHWSADDLSLAMLLWGEEAVTRYITKRGLFTEAEIRTRLELEINNQKSYHVQYWPVFEKVTGEFIGCCGLRPYDLDKSIYEMGFHLRSKYWGKGLATEAANAVIQYSMKNLKVTSFFAGHNPCNTNSKRVLEKLGFLYDGDVFYEPTGIYHPSYKWSKK